MTVKELLEKHRIKMTALSKRFGIPYRTIQNWCTDGPEHRSCPEYIVNMMDELLTIDSEQ